MGNIRNLKGKSIYYLCDLHSLQSPKDVRRYDKEPDEICLPYTYILYSFALFFYPFLTLDS